MAHDPALLEHPQLVDSVAAAARLALDNERLQAQLRMQLDELRASRARLVHAGDDARGGGSNATSTTARSSASLSLGDRAAVCAERGRAATTRRTERSLDEAEEELDECAARNCGSSPAASTRRSSPTRASRPRPAVWPRAGRCRATVSANGRRFAPAVETAAYYLIAEALTNISRYACATRAWIVITRRGGLRAHRDRRRRRRWSRPVARCGPRRARRPHRSARRTRSRAQPTG